MFLLGILFTLSCLMCLPGCEQGSSRVPVAALVGDEVWQVTVASATGVALYPVEGVILEKRTRQPIGNLPVDLHVDGSLVANSRTTSAGTFVFGRRFPALYDIVAAASHSRYLPTTYVVRLLENGKTSPANVEIIVDERLSNDPAQREFSIFGEVITASGLFLVANELVVLQDSANKTIGTALTDSRGTFEFTGILPGQYSLIVGKDSSNFVTRTIKLTVSDTGSISPAPVVQLTEKSQKTYTISGIVRLSTSQEPLGGIHVDLRKDTPDSNLIQQVFTSGEGKFFFESLAPSTYFLTIASGSPRFETQNYVVTILDDGTISPTLAEITVLPRPITTQTWPVSGNVIDGFSGSPLEYVSCNLSEVGSILTDLQGVFTFAELPAGSYRLEFLKPGYSSLGISFRLYEDGTTAPAKLFYRLVHVQEIGKGSVVGRIVDEGTERGLENLMVRLYELVWTEKKYTDPDGVDQSEENWELNPVPVKSTRTSTFAATPSGYDDSGGFRITHLEPTSTTRKYVLYIGRNQSSIATRYILWGHNLWLTEDTTNPDRVHSWTMIEVKPNTSTYLTNYEQNK